LKSLHIYFFCQKKFSDPRQGVGQITSKHLNQHTHTHTEKIWLFIFIFYKSGSDQIQICFDFFRIFNRYVSSSNRICIWLPKKKHPLYRRWMGILQWKILLRHFVNHLHGKYINDMYMFFYFYIFYHYTNKETK
jgi:hypothetical protein